MSLTKQDLDSLEKLIQKNIKSSQEEIISRLMSVLVHFPTRNEVKQMIEESPKINKIERDLNQLKDQMAEFRDDFEIRDAFTQNRLAHLEIFAQEAKLKLRMA